MKLSGLKGIGAKTEQLFNKIGVFTTDDLLNFFPRKYDIFEKPVFVRDMTERRIYSLWGTVCSSCTLTKHGKLSILKVRIADECGGQITVTFFNMPFLKNTLKPGCKYVFRGEVAFKGNLVLMEQPKMYTYNEYDKLMDSLQPIYHLCAGLTNNLVKKTIKQVIDEYRDPQEFIPGKFVERENLMSHGEAIRAMHFPDNFETLKKARERIVFEEFFLFSLAIRNIKNESIIANNTIHVEKSPYSATILANLGYELTGAQARVYDEIIRDMSGKQTMNRLVQGDVGSGKTIIAILAMMDCCYLGYQCAMMAPTEVLARQHYETICDIIEKNNLPVECALLTGSLTASAKNNVKEECRRGKVQIIIGTHAVITDNVEFHKLGLVVTDEQHRFGVRQREALHKKGEQDGRIPHIMVMSATPIPRSLALILYADLEVSVIDEKPAMRLPIKNCVVDDTYRPNAYRFIQRELDKGHQAYIICSMAKPSENEEEDSELENVVEYSNKIRKEFPPEVVIEYLHGKLPAKEKNRIIEEFSKGKINILVSTTVIEVGINVPNATVMMIENAERFGLAALHQLRGRVGRKDDQAYCIFVSNSNNAVTKERLNILKESNDGFYISEQDLKLRGPGDILGERQSGEFGFKLADIFVDSETLKKASACAKESIDMGLDEGLILELKEYVDSRMNNLNL